MIENFSFGNDFCVGKMLKREVKIFTSDAFRSARNRIMHVQSIFG